MSNEIAHELRDSPTHTENAKLRDELTRLRAENAHLLADNARLRAENAELRSRHAAQGAELADIRATLDAHVLRSRSASVFGPLEMTAGTSVGPRHRRGGRK